MEIKVKIEAPGLEGAIYALAKAFEGSAIPTTTADKLPVSGGAANEAVEGNKAEQKEDPDTTTDVKTEEKKGAAEPGISLETVRVKLAELSQEGKQSQVKGLITSYGVERLSDIPEAKYGELLEKAGEL